MAARGYGLHRIAAWAALAALALAIGLPFAWGDRGATAADRAVPAAPADGAALAGPAPAGVYRPPPDPPDRPALWENRATVKPSDAEFQAALEAAGAGGQRPGQPVVVLDPGHGGGETGAFMHDHDTDEAESNLLFARNLRTALRAAGVHVVLTREDEGLASLNFTDGPGRADLHARAEMAHFAQADLFISIHSNGVIDPATRGLEVWYVPNVALDDGSDLAFAERMRDSLADELDAYGYAGPARTMDGSCIDTEPGFCDPLYVPAPFILLDASVARAWGREPEALGLSEDRRAPAPPVDETVGKNVTPAVHKYHGPIDLIDPETQTGPAAVLRGTLMPTVLVELLYMTNPQDARVLEDPAGRAALVRGMANAILDALREEGKLPPIRHQPTIDRQISTLDRSLPLR